MPVRVAPPGSSRFTVTPVPARSAAMIRDSASAPARDGPYGTKPRRFMMTDADRRELLVIEGALRDQIRAPDLATGGLRDAIADARRRGVNVLLLDELDAAADATLRRRAADWLADRLQRAQGERFVGRVRSTDEGIAVSAVDGAVSDWA